MSNSSEAIADFIHKIRNIKTVMPGGNAVHYPMDHMTNIGSKTHDDDADAALKMAAEQMKYLAQQVMSGPTTQTWKDRDRDERIGRVVMNADGTQWFDPMSYSSRRREYEENVGQETQSFREGLMRPLQKKIEDLEIRNSELKTQVERLKKDNLKLINEHHVEYETLLTIALNWRDISFLFRDGHSDDISFSDACEAADELERSINLKSAKANDKR